MRKDPQWLIVQLVDAGMTEMEITDSLNADGVDVTQATINRIKTGGIKRTGFDIGMGLMRLYSLRADVRQRA